MSYEGKASFYQPCTDSCGREGLVSDSELSWLSFRTGEQCEHLRGMRDSFRDSRAV